MVRENGCEIGGIRESGAVTDSDSVPAAPSQLGPIARFVFWASFVAGWLWTLYLLWHSPGTFTDDEIGHFIIARDAWHSPSLIVDSWGRAGNTLIYMIPVLFGLTATRVAATLMAAMTVLFATRLAKKLGAEYYFAVPIVVWFQLWFCDFSHVAITEIPFSLMMVLSAYFFVSGELLAVSIVVGLLPCVRTEGLALTLVWAAYCLWKKNWKGAIIAILPVLLLNLITRLVFGASQLNSYTNTHPIGQLQMQLFGVGSWSYYPKVLMAYVGLPILTLALYALGAILKQSARMLVFAPYGLYMTIHVVIYHFGLYGAGGDVRYLFPLAPAVGVAAVFGLEYIASVCRSSHIRIFSSDEKWVTPAVVAIALALIFVDGVRYKVYPLDPEAVDAKITADWLRQEKLTDHPILCTHVYFYYYLPLRVPPKRLWQNPEVSAAKPGTIAIWDTHYSEIFGLPLASLSPANGWELLREFDSREARFLVFEKRGTETFRPELPALNQAGGKSAALNPSYNPRYLAKNGKAIFLTGSHTWNDVQYISDRGSNVPYGDFSRYLDWLRGYGHNFTRLWVVEQSAGAPWCHGIRCVTFSDWAYARSGTCCALDGGNKFDLNAWNQAYFDNLQNRVLLAKKKAFTSASCYLTAGHTS